MDASFTIGFPDHRWVRENVLQFYREENFEKGTPQTVVIVNATDESVRQLKVECIDKFLIFDLAPKSELTLRASPPKGDYPGVRITGQGAVPLSADAGFNVKGTTKPLEFRIEIRNEEVTVSSPFLQPRSE